MTFTECQKGGLNMKKIFLLLLCVALCFSFVGCVEDDVPEKEVYTPQSSVEKSEEIFGLNESAVFDALKFTAIEIKQSDGKDFFTPEAGNVFVGVKFQIENISDEEKAVSTILLFDGYTDDIKCDYSINASCVFDEGTLDGTIAPGKKLVGWYAVEVPASWRSLELQVQSNWLSNNKAKFVFEK